MEGYEAQLATILLGGVIAGVVLLIRGMGGYRTAARIGDTGTSRIASLAAGEVRVSGIIEPAEVTLVSPLQSAPCVYYRASVEFGDDDAENPDLSEERAVGFRVHDETGEIRVFPRAARWDAPMYLDESTGSVGEEPAALSPRRGSAIAPAELDRDAAIAALLTVRSSPGGPDDGDGDTWLFGGGWSAITTGRKRRHYREARLAPGDAVTVIGRAMPFSDLADPAEADLAVGSAIAADDPEVAADLAAARAAGTLAADAETAWGNAAIPGFGIGRPVRSAQLDEGATALPLGTAEDAARIERRFTIAPETLVLASAPDVPMLIAHGVPGIAAERHQDQFMIGLLGAVLAIGSAMALAILVSGGFRV